jgi:large subunit ribosomal protein L16
MLMPKKTKWRKSQRGKRKGTSKGAKTIEFGDYGLRAEEACWLSAAQIEATRVAINRKISQLGSKSGKLYLRVFPDKPISKKPAETRMGKGKGAPEFWASVVKRERIICEVGGVNEQEARMILHSATYKLPIKTKFVKKS